MAALPSGVCAGGQSERRVSALGLERTFDVESDLRTWGRRHPTADDKARSLVLALKEYASADRNQPGHGCGGRRL